MNSTLFQKTKKYLGILLIFSSIFSLNSCDKNTSLLGGNNFNLQALIVTKILPERTNVSATLKWSSIGGAAHYELYRKQDGGAEIPIGDSKITTEKTFFVDQNLKQDSEYEYIIHAINLNNKVIASGTVKNLKPITANELQPATITGLKVPPDVNVISRTANLSWSSVPGSDLYYSSIVNDQSGKQVFGMFTKETTININKGSEFKPTELIQRELPLLDGGLANSVKHSFTVYTIKFNNPDAQKASAIGIRESEKVNLITG